MAGLIVGAAVLVAVPAVLAWASATGRLESWWARENRRQFAGMAPRVRTLCEYLAALMIAQLVVGLPLTIVALPLGFIPDGWLPDWLQVAVAVALITVLIAGVIFATVRIRQVIRDANFFG